MPQLATIEELLIHEVKDLYSAETQLVKALPNLARAATDEILQDLLLAHLSETQAHVERLQQVAKLLDSSPGGRTCKAMQGLIQESEEVMREPAESSCRDLALIIAAQKVEHYEISGYGSVLTLAETLGNEEVAALLQATLDEEELADDTLGGVAEEILVAAEMPLD